MKNSIIITTHIQKFLDALPKEWDRPQGFQISETTTEGFKETYLSEDINSWQIAGLANPFNALHLRIDVPHDATQENRLNIRAGLSASGGKMAYEGELAKNGTLLLRSTTLTNTDFNSGADINESSLLTRWVDLLPLGKTHHSEIWFQPLRSGMQFQKSVIHILTDEYCIPNTEICLKNPALSVTHVYHSKRPTDFPTIAGAVFADLTLGKPVELRMDLSDSDTASIQISGKNGEGLPGRQIY